MNKKRIAIYFFGLLPFVIVSLVYKNLPDLVPMQFEMGQGVRYGEKWQLFILSGVCFIMGVGMPLLAKVDPRRKNYIKFSSVYESIVLLIEIFMTIIMCVVIFESLYPSKIPVVRVIIGSVGVLFTFLGNMMPKVKSNFFTGVKTPWALSSEAVWNKTQRLGGKLLFLGGLLMVIGAVVLPIQIMGYAVIGVAIVIAFPPTIMSYVWYQQEMKSLGK